ncbi:MAG: lactate utilization protein, partial [Nitrococcus sp.]|nr:lactate utilization protein [Nitrococcus sp.]
VDYLEAVWERLQAPGQAMPCAVNLITGPSRTGDVEQTTRLSAHDPAASTCCCLADRLGNTHAASPSRIGCEFHEGQKYELWPQNLQHLSAKPDAM